MSGGGIVPVFRITAASLAGGIVGSTSRVSFEWLMDGIGQPAWASRLAVNVLGALAIGCWFGRAAGRGPAAAQAAPRAAAEIVREDLCVAGFLGGLTTVSGFAWDVASALGAGDPARAALVVGVNGIVGIGACFAGFSMMRAARAGPPGRAR